MDSYIIQNNGMLIRTDEILKALWKHNIQINGALHIGAHDCEELPFYFALGVQHNDIIWIDAFKTKVDQNIQRNIPNVYHATITDKDDDIVEFNLSNNVQSSSVLQMGTHAVQYPSIVYVHKIEQRTITVPTFYAKNNLDPRKYNFWNFDIQGAELMALKGAASCIQYVDAMYLEVNAEELYKGCGLIGDIDTFLDGHGFTRVLTDITRQGWGDALYIRTRR